MPTVVILDEPCRVRPMLKAIGTQESLEVFCTTRPHDMHGPSRAAAWERERLAYAYRRNAAERALRVHEQKAWEHWRRADAAGRAAIYAMLTDLPDEHAGRRRPNGTLRLKPRNPVWQACPRRESGCRGRHNGTCDRRDCAQGKPYVPGSGDGQPSPE